MVADIIRLALWPPAFHAIFNALSLPEHASLLEKLTVISKKTRNEDCKPNKPIVRENMTDAEVKTWLYWMRRKLMANQAIEISGRVPELEDEKGEGRGEDLVLLGNAELVLGKHGKAGLQCRGRRGGSTLIDEKGIIASKGIINNRQHIRYVLSGKRVSESNGYAEPETDAAANGEANGSASTSIAKEVHHV